MSSRIMKINLNKINNFAYALQNSRGTVNQRLEAVMDKWAAETMGEYNSLTPYNKLQNKTSYYTVESSRDGNGLYVAVGHASFIAKFLEVGTKPHRIVHKKNGKPVLAEVKGIKGNKALGKAWNKKHKEISDRIAEEINNILLGGR